MREKNFTTNKWMSSRILILVCTPLSFVRRDRRSGVCGLHMDLTGDDRTTSTLVEEAPTATRME